MGEGGHLLLEAALLLLPLDRSDRSEAEPSASLRLPASAAASAAMSMSEPPLPLPMLPKEPSEPSAAPRRRAKRGAGLEAPAVGEEPPLLRVGEEPPSSQLTVRFIGIAGHHPADPHGHPSTDSHLKGAQACQRHRHRHLQEAKTQGSAHIQQEAVQPRHR